MKRILAISDIHGEIELLEQLLEKVNYHPDTDQLILLGDYVDRGPHSSKVLEKVIQLQQEGAILLKGNHEDMMIKALTTDEENSWKHWAVRNGGDKTLQSYGFTVEEYGINEEAPFQKPALPSSLLAKHVSFIQTLHPLVEYGGYIFVHAGIDPKQKIEETDPYRLMWIRDEFYKHYKGDTTVIFGHTPAHYLHNDKNNHDVFFGDNNIIGIDGGAVYGGQLNCLVLPSKEVFTMKSLNRGGTNLPRNNYEELVKGRVFFGGIDAIDQLLDEKDIDVIYDLRAEISGELPNEKSIHKGISSKLEQQEESIEEAVQSVMNAYNEGKNVYFHCNTGRGRGGTIATAVLLELNEANSVNEAEDKVKKIRPATNLRAEFKQALKNIYDK